MRLPFVVALVLMCSSAQFSLGKSNVQQKPAAAADIPKSIAESVSGTLQFAEGNLLGMAEAMPEDKFIHPYGRQV
jgi:hypothetical protein